MYDGMYYSVFKQFFLRSVETPVVLQPSKVIRVENARSSPVFFGDESNGAARETGVSRSFSSSHVTMCLPSLCLCRHHLCQYPDIVCV